MDVCVSVFFCAGPEIRILYDSLNLQQLAPTTLPFFKLSLSLSVFLYAFCPLPVGIRIRFVVVATIAGVFVGCFLSHSLYPYITSDLYIWVSSFTYTQSICAVAQYHQFGLPNILLALFHISISHFDDLAAFHCHHRHKQMNYDKWQRKQIVKIKFFKGRSPTEIKKNRKNACSILHIRHCNFHFSNED